MSGIIAQAPKLSTFLYYYGIRSIQERNLSSILTETELTFERCLKSNKKFYDQITYILRLGLYQKVTAWARRDNDQNLVYKKSKQNKSNTSN